MLLSFIFSERPASLVLLSLLMKVQHHQHPKLQKLDCVISAWAGGHDKDFIPRVEFFMSNDRCMIPSTT